MLIAAIDAGSPKNCGWATNEPAQGCLELTRLVARIAGALQSGEMVALGVESPLWAPLHNDYDRMTSARGPLEREHRRPWSAGAGACSLAAGLVNLGWVLQALAAAVGPVRLTTQIDRFRSKHADLLIWEAFVTGRLKVRGTSHCEDARQAVEIFHASWASPTEPRSQMKAVNLAYAVAKASGHVIGDWEACLPVPIFCKTA